MINLLNSLVSAGTSDFTLNLTPFDEKLKFSVEIDTFFPINVDSNVFTSIFNFIQSFNYFPYILRQFVFFTISRY